MCTLLGRVTLKIAPFRNAILDGVENYWMSSLLFFCGGNVAQLWSDPHQLHFLYPPLQVICFSVKGCDWRQRQTGTYLVLHC